VTRVLSRQRGAGDRGGLRKGRPPTPGTASLRIGWTSGSMAAAQNSPLMGPQRVRIRSGSDEEAGSRPSDELVLSTSSFIFGSSRLEDPDPLQIIGSANQNMRLPRVEVKAAIIGPNTRRVTMCTSVDGLLSAPPGCRHYVRFYPWMYELLPIHDSRSLALTPECVPNKIAATYRDQNQCG